MPYLSPHRFRCGDSRRRRRDSGCRVVPREDPDQRTGDERDGKEDEKGILLGNPAVRFSTYPPKVSRPAAQGNLNEWKRRASVPRIQPRVSALLGTIPLRPLSTRSGAASERVGERLAGVHPVVVFLGGMLLCYAVLASITVAVGVIFTETILPLGGLDEADSAPAEWLAGDAHLRSTTCRSSDRRSRVRSSFRSSSACSRSVLRFAVTGSWRRSSSSASLWSRRRTARQSSSSPRTARRPPTRRPAAGRELPIRTCRCVDRRLLGARAPAHLSNELAAWSRCRLVDRVDGPDRRRNRADVPRHAHPLDTLAGVLIGIAALALVVFIVRITGVVARRRDLEAAGAPW